MTKNNKKKNSQVFDSKLIYTKREDYSIYVRERIFQNLYEAINCHSAFKNVHSLQSEVNAFSKTVRGLSFNAEKKNKKKNNNKKNNNISETKTVSEYLKVMTNIYHADFF